MLQNFIYVDLHNFQVDCNSPLSCVLEKFTPFFDHWQLDKTDIDINYVFINKNNSSTHSDSIYFLLYRQVFLAKEYNIFIVQNTN